MVESFINSVKPNNGPDWIAWLIAFIPLLISIGFIYKIRRQTKQTKKVLSILDRYQTVHTSLDDFMESAALYLEPTLTQIILSLEKVANLNLASTNYIQNLLEKTSSLKKLSDNIVYENDNSASRAKSTIPKFVRKSFNPLTSILFWAIVGSSIFVQTLFNYAFSTTILIWSLVSVMLANIFIYGLTLRRLRQEQRKYSEILGYASQLISLFNTRRNFLDETSRQILNEHMYLMSNSQQLTSIPQARGLFSGLVQLSKLGHSIEAVHRASDMNNDAPLFSAGVALDKLVEKRYLKVATEKHIQLTKQLEQGVAFQIFPKDFMELCDQLVSNSLTFSKPGDKLLIKGKIQKDKAVITFIDNGVGIESNKLNYLFAPQHILDIDADQEFKVSLGLQICKVITSRFGGELKVASKVGKGTICTVIAPRQATAMHIDIPRRVTSSVGAIN